jgi:LPXTG-motif cell wall-anchored protein
VLTVLVPVPENSEVSISVDLYSEDDPADGSWSEFFRTGVDCQPGGEPRASIGDVNCTNLTVAVTLDNTQSPVQTIFGIVAGDTRIGYSYEELFDVAADAQRVVAVPLPNNADVDVFVGDEFLPFEAGGIAFDHEIFEVSCPETAARPPVAVKGGAKLPQTGVEGAKLPQTGVEGAKLPQTGGFNLALPLLGLGLLTGGAGILALSGCRRRY